MAITFSPLSVDSITDASHFTVILFCFSERIISLIIKLCRLPECSHEISRFLLPCIAVNIFSTSVFSAKSEVVSSPCNRWFVRSLISFAFNPPKSILTDCLTVFTVNSKVFSFLGTCKILFKCNFTEYLVSDFNCLSGENTIVLSSRQ